MVRRRRSYADVYFSPDGSVGDHVIAFIGFAAVSLDVAMYSFTHDRIASALIEAHERGVAVRLLADKTQAGSRYSDWERIAAAGIEVRLDREKGIMHHKMVVCDAVLPTRAVGTGSFNWTASADERNREGWYVLRLKQVVRACHAEFEEMWLANAPKE